MRFKLFAFAAMLLLSILPVIAQETPVLNTVSFNGYGFSYADNLPISNLSVNITRHAGDPPDAIIPGGAEPPYTRFDLYLDEFTPDPTYYPWTDVTVLFYNAADVNYSYTVLQTLLQQRPALTSRVRPDGSELLPVHLPKAGVAVLQARPHYIETENVTGISYLLSQSLSVDPIYQSSYLYMFQGISQDKSTYITVVAPLQTLAVPEMAAFEAFASEPDVAKFEASYHDYLVEAAKMVDEATPHQFTPNLDQLDAFARTITVK